MIPSQGPGLRDTARAMAEENIEIVRRAFEGGLLEAAQSYWHPQIEYIEDPRFPGAGTYKGRDAVIQRWRSYLDVMGDEDDIAVAVERIFDAGEQQVWFVRLRGHAMASGIPWEHLWGYVVKVKEERVAYLRAFYEPREALQAAGLSE